MRWQNGVFVVDTPTTGIVGSIERRNCEQVFLDLLTRFAADRRFVSATSRASNYAPRLFAGCPDRERFKLPDFRKAMERLFAAKTIQLGTYRDAKRRPQECIVLAQESPP
ncbi:MAG: hypothetical protein JO095_17710 [Alphaproteobacteria bacterium]|nr:hypothetical protein [Alphaproteobacteria bacterium]